MRQVQVTITQEMIDKARGIDSMSASERSASKTPWMCPIDLGLVDAGIRNWHTAGSFLYQYDGAGATPYTKKVYLPPAARDFVNNYDNKREVEPFEFTILVEE